MSFDQNSAGQPQQTNAADDLQENLMEMGPEQRLKVSVIVPARNEEENIAACLASLVSQEGISFELIVVNDASTDRTREIVSSFAGVQPAGATPGANIGAKLIEVKLIEVKLIDAPPLPSGWIGKNNAVAAGARLARGEWLLFTDADTVHQPGSLARAVAEAEQRGVALLSYSPEQKVGSFWEKAIMPLVFSDLAAHFQPALVSNPASPVAAANGQYLLISRAAYDAVGGHAAIATSLLEDVQLARNVKSSGHPIFFRYGPDAVSARMYRNLAQLREGWTKNLSLLFPNSAQLEGLRIAEFAVMLLCLVIIVLSVFQGWPMVALNAGVMMFLLIGNFMSRVHRAHFSFAISLFSIAGLPVYAYLLRRSRLYYKYDGITWKGRSYAGNEQNSSSGASVTDQEISQAAGANGQKHSGKDVHELSASR